ncbi:MAG: hypothetical protein QNJ36_16960 [Calothrix sp. MO_167.B42]|nr:hypothetical protein [Calothrix sp. MO_167.B42]
MKPIKLKTTDGSHLEVNPDAISEIVEVEKKQDGFLFIIPEKEAVYEVHMMDKEVYRVSQKEHDKLKNS